MDEIKYKLIPVDLNLKEGQSPKDAVFPALKDRIIEKQGVVVKFTLSQMEDADKFNKKNLKEIIAKKKYEEAIMTNIEQNNKYGKEIKEMEEEKRYTVHMYQESFAMAKACGKKIAELEAGIKESEEEMVLIKEQIPELAEVISPYAGGDAQVDAKGVAPDKK